MNAEEYQQVSIIGILSDCIQENENHRSESSSMATTTVSFKRSFNV